MSANSTMRALIKESPAPGYELKEMPVPQPVDDEVLIKVQKVAICGSDIALFEWNDVAKVIATTPFIPGHEAVGVVVATGPQAKTLGVGDRVAVENHFFCGKCYSCKDDRGDICRDMSQYGHGKGTRHGGFSQFSIVAAKYCYRLTTDISDEQAVLLEPLGVAFNGVEQIDVRGHDVLVLGAGPIGLLSAAVAKALGATRVIVADVSASRLSTAVQLGADVTIDCRKSDLRQEVLRLTDGDGVARLVEATGATQLVNSCFSMLRKGAKLVLIGLPKGAIHVEDPLPNVIFKSLSLFTVHGRRIWHTWHHCERLIADKKVDPSVIVSHRLPMSNWKQAFDVLMAGQCCKIVIDPQQ